MNAIGVMPIIRRSNILDAAGRPMQVELRREDDRLGDLRYAPAFHRAGLDAAASNRHTQKHFTDADGRPLGAVLSEQLPRIRDWLRYETRNNADGRGIVETLVTAVIGTGPTLQVHTGDEELDKIVQEGWLSFAEDCDFVDTDVSVGELLVLGLREQCVAGEDFLLPTNDPNYRGRVKLRLRPISPERISTPWDQVTNARIKDGIEFDEGGKKIRFHVSKSHPKDPNLAAAGLFGKFETVEAADLIHSFIRTEPDQHRGFPWFTPALPVMSQARRFCLAVLSAAETAADLSAIMHTTSGDLSPQPLKDVDAIGIERNAIMNLPQGWEISQLKAEHPPATFKDFMRELRRQQGRPLNMPYNIAAADSSEYNFASGRMDHQLFHLTKLVLRNWIARKKLRRILKLWLAEARLVDPRLFGLSDLDVKRIVRTSQWFFKDTNAHGDPLKEEKARTESLHNGSKTFIDVCAEQGLDWETQLEKDHKVRVRRLELAAKLKEKAVELELSEGEASAAVSTPPATGIDPDKEDDDEQAKDKKQKAAAA